MVLYRTGRPSTVYLLRAAVAGAELLHDIALLPETLGARERLMGIAPPPRAPFHGLANPLSFLRLLRGPTALVKLCLATFFVCWAEGKNTNDLYQMWLQDGPGRGVGLGVGGGNVMTVLCTLRALLAQQYLLTLVGLFSADGVSMFFWQICHSSHHFEVRRAGLYNFGIGPANSWLGCMGHEGVYSSHGIWISASSFVCQCVIEDSPAWCGN